MSGKAKKKTDIEINTLIQAEKERLNQIYINLPEKKYKTALRLIDNVAFMSVTLDKLMEEITNSDFVVKTKNASQEFLKESPALTSYNKMYSNFLKGIQQLNSLLPSDDFPPPISDKKKKPEDSFEKFIQKRKDRK